MASQKGKNRKCLLPFVRMAGTFLSEFSLVEVTCAPSLAEGDELAAIIRGVSAWVNKTKAGSRWWTDTCGEANIGDLLCSPKGSARFLRKEGVLRLRETYRYTGEGANYDKHLVDLDEEQEEAARKRGGR